MQALGQTLDSTVPLIFRKYSSSFGDERTRLREVKQLVQYCTMNALVSRLFVACVGKSKFI